MIKMRSGERFIRKNIDIWTEELRCKSSQYKHLPQGSISA